MGAETGRRELLSVRRPKGRKTYVAERLPDSPLYGENRGRILCDIIGNGDTMMTHYQHAAIKLVQRLGWNQAVKEAARVRDLNSYGTFSYAHGNAICKALADFATIERR